LYGIAGTNGIGAGRETVGVRRGGAPTCSFVLPQFSSVKGGQRRRVHTMATTAIPNQTIYINNINEKVKKEGA